MNKILLDFGIPDSRDDVQEYIAGQMGFGSGSAKNLEALYDKLISISEPTAIGIFMPLGDMIDLDFDLMVYLDKVCEVFTDAEEANPSIAVIFGDLPSNPGYEDEYDDMLDSYIDDYTGERIFPDGVDDFDETDDEDEEDDEEAYENMPGDKDMLMIYPDRLT